MVYLHKDKERFFEAINLVVYQTGLSAEAVEKDYYVTMILKHLAEKFSFIVFIILLILLNCSSVTSIEYTLATVLEKRLNVPICIYSCTNPAKNGFDGCNLPKLYISFNSLSKAIDMCENSSLV